MDILVLRDYRGSDFHIDPKSATAFWGGNVPSKLFDNREAVDGLNKIKVVLGANQGVTSIAPRLLYNLVHCIKLDLSSNKITSLPLEMSSMVNLEVI